MGRKATRRGLRAGCGDDFAGVRGHLIRNVQIENLGPKGWFVLKMKRQGELAKNAENKDMTDYVKSFNQVVRGSNPRTLIRKETHSLLL